MITGPKYKIARRLGAPIFEKTQNQKYALNLEKKLKNKKGFSKPKSEFGIQLNEKQKARFIYGLSEKQFSNYVKEAISKKTSHAPALIFEYLELRLDNVAYRLGFATTRSGSRQMVTHGHLKVNGRKVDVPSMRLKIGDKVEINDRSQNKPLFADLDEKFKNTTVPSWLKLDAAKRAGEVQGKPIYVKTDSMFDLNTVIEFYSR
jgi:small subunit ribosomal protein S4